MEPLASHHLAVVVLSLATLFLHMCRLDRVIFARPAKSRSRSSRPQPTFGINERAGQTVLVDPDGQITWRRAGRSLT